MALAAALLAFVAAPTALAQITVNGSGSYATIQDAIDAAGPGDDIFVPNGTYNENPEVPASKTGLTITGESQAGVVIVATGANRGILVNADGVTLETFTLDGTGLTTGLGYGIKVNGPDTYPGSEDRVDGLTIQDVTVFGSSRSEIDLNGVDNATLQRLTLNGNNTAGVALGVTDGNNIVIDGIDTDGLNQWGGIALYTQGRYFFPGITGVTITNTGGVLEPAPLYAQEKYYESPVIQDDPAPYLVTQLDADGYTYVLTNDTFRSDARQFTFFFRSEASAQAYDAIIGGGSEIRERDTTPFDGSAAGALSNSDLRPILECVARNNAPNPSGDFTARFGYLNEKGEAVEVPIGGQNKITGGGLSGQDQGQPTVFEYPAPNNVPGQPGRTSYRGLFSVDFDGSNLVWTLNGKTTTASSNSQACPEGCDASARPSWDSGELISNGDGTGYLMIDSPNGFLQVKLLTESSANIALVELQDASGNTLPSNGSGNLNGSLGSGSTMLEYTGSGEPDQVRVVVRQLEPGTSSFMFRVTDRCKYSLQVDPVVSLSGATSAGAESEGAFALRASQPNPFRGTTTIAFSLPERADVTLRVFDVMGREVATLAEGSLAAGGHEVEWDGRDASGASVASGVYVYRLDAGSLSATRRVTVLR